ncbi:MAG TPA: hypothetical protein VNT30_05250 [Stellaceae bacterium]|nr:hypothetical protein [Stellaceae bacterium]
MSESWGDMTPDNKLEWLHSRAERLDRDMEKAFTALRSVQRTLSKLAGIIDQQDESLKDLVREARQSAPVLDAVEAAGEPFLLKRPTKK